MVSVTGTVTWAMQVALEQEDAPVLDMSFAKGASSI